SEWLPRVADRYPEPAGEPATPDEAMARLLHRPERMVLPELAPYPAHLHIDLLPEWQGRGHGRELMRTFLNALRDAGVPAVHLVMSTANKPARAFYDRMGFHEIVTSLDPTVACLGRTTADAGPLRSFPRPPAPPPPRTPRPAALAPPCADSLASQGSREGKAGPRGRPGRRMRRRFRAAFEHPVVRLRMGRGNSMPTPRYKAVGVLPWHATHADARNSARRSPPSP